MPSSRRRQRELLDQVAKSAVVDDDLQAAKEALEKPEKGAGPVREGVVDDREGQHVKTHRASKSERRSRPNLRHPPPERRCQASVHVKGAEPRRCTRWTMRLEDEVFDAFCSSHSSSERATVVRRKGADNLRTANESRHDAAQLPPLFESPIDTQDDVARERLNLVRHLVAPHGKIAAAIGSTALHALKDMSAHIERYGSHQGVEGGHSIMRLLPGVTIVEANFDYDRVFTKADLEAVMDGMAQDEKDGIQPAVTVEEQALRYLGRVVRPVEKTRYELEGRGQGARRPA